MAKRVATTFFGECRIFRLDIFQRIDDHETIAIPGRVRGRPPQLIAARVFGCQCRSSLQGHRPNIGDCRIGKVAWRETLDEESHAVKNAHDR